jgi:NADP-dependent 3-hydroxy acid dehydrogenase YdfG
VRTAVITGGSSGIGLAVARLLVRRGGWNVLLAARGPERLAAAGAELCAATVVCDVTDDAQVAALAAAASALGGCDLLVQSAGVAGRVGLRMADVEEYRRVLETNYVALVRVVQAFWPQLVERRARVANVVSVAGTVPFGTTAPYTVSKHAAIAYSRALVRPARAHGVRVCTINPGPVTTPGFPQSRLLARPFGRLVTVDAEHCAERLLAAVERGASEAFVPQWWRAIAALEGIAPGLCVRLAARAPFGVLLRLADPAPAAR